MIADTSRQWTVKDEYGPERSGCLENSRATIRLYITMDSSPHDHVSGNKEVEKPAPEATMWHEGQT